MTVEANEKQPLEATRPGGGRWRWLRGIPYVVISFGLAGALIAVLRQFIPTRLDVTTTALGYPTRFNFNIFRQWYNFGLFVYVFPLTALIAYAVLTHSNRRNSPLRARSHEPDPSHPEAALVSTSADPVLRAAQHGLRVAGVGLVLGLEASVALHTRISSGIAVFILASILYTATVFGLVIVVQRWQRSELSFWTTASLVNAAGTAACVIALYGVSRATEV